MPSAGIAAVLIGITVATVIYFFFSTSEEDETTSSHLVRGYRDGGNIPSSYPTTDRRTRRSSHPYRLEYTRETAGICSICLESVSIGSQVVLTCEHAFHEKCIHEWVSKAQNASCPNCRSNIP